MLRTPAPTVEATKDFILIRIPRKMFSGNIAHGKTSRLERGLAKSLKEAEQGELYGPFPNAKDFLDALKRPV